MKTLKMLIIFSIINFGVLTGLILGSTQNGVAGESSTIAIEDQVVQTDVLALSNDPVPETPKQEAVVEGKQVDVPASQKTPMANTASPPKANPAPAPTPAPKPQGCIVSIDGVSYDVTTFKKIHSGGDIFKCGTDMTASFYSQHSTQTLKAMQKYRI